MNFSFILMRTKNATSKLNIIFKNIIYTYLSRGIRLRKFVYHNTGTENGCIFRCYVFALQCPFQ